jgi:hypothetical protein
VSLRREPYDWCSTRKSSWSPHSARAGQAPTRRPGGGADVTPLCTAMTFQHTEVDAQAAMRAGRRSSAGPTPITHRENGISAQGT